MHKKILRSLLLIAIITIYAGQASIAQINTSGGIGKMKQGAQQQPQQEEAQEYTIAGITVSGTRFLDNDLLITVTGLSVGDKIRIPTDEKITRAIRNLWKQELFSDISITATKIVGDKVFLNIEIQ